MSNLSIIDKCWNQIYRSLSNFHNHYAEFKARNPNITIIPNELNPKLKIHFANLVEVLLEENKSLNGKKELKNGLDVSNWVCGVSTEYLLRNDVLGTIVLFGIESQMPKELIDEVTYFFTVLVNELPSAFLINENVHRPLSLLLDTLCTQTSKYSLVLVDKICWKIKEYPPLWDVLAADNNSFAKLLAQLFTISEAFNHALRLAADLILTNCTDFEDFLLNTSVLLPQTLERISKSFNAVLESNWADAEIDNFCACLANFDQFVLNLSDSGKALVATSYKDRFVDDNIKRTLRLLKLYDGTVIKSLDFLRKILLQVASLELSLPLVFCYKQYYFSEDEEHDCLNLMRLFFAEGESSDLSFAIIDLLDAMVKHESHQILCVFEETTKWNEKPYICTIHEHAKLTDILLNCVKTLPSQSIDLNIDNMSLLYKNHLFMMEREIPDSEDHLNNTEQASIILTSLLVKMIDSSLTKFWGRSPTDNLRLCRLFISLLTHCDCRFVMENLLKEEKPYSVLFMVGRLTAATVSGPIEEYLKKPETTRSISRFRAGLFDKIHEAKKVTQLNMFDVGGVLDELLAGMEPKTVGALSGNVILLQNFLLRILAIVQVQSTRCFKIIRYNSE